MLVDWARISAEGLPSVSLSMAANSSLVNNTTNIITTLGNVFKERLAVVLLQNMNQLNDLAKQGKLN